MNRFNKKPLLFLLIVVFTISQAACGSTPAPAASSSPISATASADNSSTPAASPSSVAKEPITITWLGGVNSKDITTGILDIPVFNEIIKLTGITIDFSPNLGLQNPDEKILILVASNDLPDIVTSTNSTIVPQIMSAKAAIAMDDLLATNGQNVAKNAAEMIKISKLTNSDETHSLYFLSSDSGNDGKGDIMGLDNDWVVRWDLYKKLGMPKINNYDDLLKLGEDMVKLEPIDKDGKPNYAFGLFLGESWGHLLMSKPADNYAGIKSYHLTAAFDNATDTVVPYYQDPNSPFWQETQFFNKAFQKGLLDPESATMKFQNFMDKAKTGRYMISPCNWMLGGASEQFFADNQPEKGYAPIVFGEIKPSSFFSDASVAGTNWINFITKSCKNPDRAMDLLNFLYTPEAVELLSFGIEGKDWNPKDGFVERTPETIAKAKSDTNYYKTIGFGMFASLLSQRAVEDPRGFVTYENPEVIMKNALPFLQDFCTTMKVKYPAEILQKSDHYSGWNSLFNNIALVPNSDLSSKDGQLSAYYPTAMTVAVFQKDDASFEAEKKAIIQKSIDMGANELLQFYTQKYDEAKKVLAELK